MIATAEREAEAIRQAARRDREQFRAELMSLLSHLSPLPGETADLDDDEDDDDELVAQAGTASRLERYGCQAGSTGPADTISDCVACGATGLRRGTMPHSAGSRSPLRALHDRHDATTLSHVCGPAPRARHDVVEVLGGPAAVLAAMAVAGEHRPRATAARWRGTGPARSARGG